MNWLTKKCWEHTKKLEGNFTIDEGGATKFGICWKYDAEHLAALGYIEEEDVEALTEEHAIIIFEKKYIIQWKHILLKDLPETMIRVLDMTFHEGKYGWMSFQRMYNGLGIDSELLSVDGACGAKTQAAIKKLVAWSNSGVDTSLNDTSLASLINVHRAYFYKEIFELEKAANDPRAMRKYNSALRRLV